MKDPTEEGEDEAPEASGGIGEVNGIVADIGIAVPRLRVAGLAFDRIGRAESAQAAVVEASHGVVQAAFAIAFVGCEGPLRGCVRLIPRFAKRILPLLTDFLSDFPLKKRPESDNPNRRKPTPDLQNHLQR